MYRVQCPNLTSDKMTVFFPQKLKTVILCEVKFSLGVQVNFFSGSKLKTPYQTYQLCATSPPLSVLCCAVLCCTLLCCEEYEHEHCQLLASNTCLNTCHRFSCKTTTSKRMFRTAAFSVCIASAAAFSFGEEMSCVLVLSTEFNV